jgi:hypothetical protein
MGKAKVYFTDFRTLIKMHFGEMGNISYLRPNFAKAVADTVKNIGMGCGSRAGKTEQHSGGKAHIKQALCRGCRRCLGSCNYDAIVFRDSAANSLLNRRMAEYTKAVVDSRPSFHISLVVDVSPYCDCHSENDAPILPTITTISPTLAPIQNGKPA